MYDELVNLLRRCGKQKCKNCEYEYVLGCVTKMNEKAADAIEELSMKLHGDEAAIAGMQREIERMVVADKPGWIPVTKRLPEKTNHYLVHVKCGYDGKFVSAWEQVAWFCEKFYWEHMHGDEVFEEKITHWMPLPEPPKEEPS